MAERKRATPADLPVAPGPILVVGDIMCDHYVWGDVERISPEAPVQVLRWEREADRPGGAANVAKNLTALGCRVKLVGIVGNDDKGRWLLEALRGSGVNTSGVIKSKDRPTTVKTRVIARGQHVLRVDRESRSAMAADDERRIIAAVKSLGQNVSAVICSDYGKGVLSDRVISTALARRRFSLVDPKGRDFSKYRGAQVLTPNEKELMETTSAGALAGDGGERAVAARASSLVRRLGLNALLVTRGAKGMDLFERRRRGILRTHVPAAQRHEVFDVTGAGDTVAAVMTLAAAAGMPLADAARMANAAAGIVVGVVGTAAADSDTLARVIAGEASQARSKVLPRAAVAARVADARTRGATLVFTNGCFDVLHVGHLHMLQRARALGDLLVVAVNDDESVTRLKGKGMPIVPASQRAEILAALRFVDFVTVFSEPTPAQLIRTLRPDILVKGGNHTIDTVVGRDIVERYGGRVVVIPRLR
jgi:D-beta-D-heptose 7-phosphate kinase/D-beta-D-heptose 1-phosphate adenosyltransferase